MSNKVKVRCEGWRRHGGAVTLGPARWEQCKTAADVTLTVEQEKTERMPACIACWSEAKNRGIKILASEPL